MKRLPRLPLALPDPASMTAREINKELDRLEVIHTRITNDMVAAGRGSETCETTWYKRRDYNPDPLTIAYCDVSYRRNQLRREIDRRMGPGAPARFPKDQLRFFKPLTRA